MIHMSALAYENEIEIHFHNACWRLSLAVIAVTFGCAAPHFARSPNIRPADGSGV